VAFLRFLGTESAEKHVPAGGKGCISRRNGGVNGLLAAFRDLVSVCGAVGLVGLERGCRMRKTGVDAAGNLGSERLSVR